ncbi:MAG: hypothetical protein OXC30_06180 [Alphaproteobacteria bacterium]|nr:hypothetical protein [Alphaproteobacteria bacterium]
MSQKDICVDSQDKAWENLKKIHDEFCTSHFHNIVPLKQKNNLRGLQTLLLQNRSALQCFVSDDLLECASVNILTYVLCENYRQIIMN